MSIYVMADIHGEYDKFISMLKKINFTDRDTLYILGDVIDRGPEPVKLLQDLCCRANVYPIVGNHELMALAVLKKLLVEITSGNADSHIKSGDIRMIMEWNDNGGGVTLEQFRRLPLDERYQLVEYMDEFSPYETVDAGDRSFILVHSGLGNFSPDKKLWDYSLEELACIRSDCSRRYFNDDSIYIVSGHTPTQAITGKAQIYRNNNNICIDCGAVYGGRLACLRLDDMKEFYL